MDLGIGGNAALVAASSSGLGLASAAVLAREGVNVVVNGRDEAKLEAAVEELSEEGSGDVIGVPGDLTDPDATAELVTTTVETFGRLDHLVTNTGGPPATRFFETTDEEWQWSFDLLVMSAIRLIREAGEHLRADGGGTVVAITSRTAKEASETNVLSSSVRMTVVGIEKVLSRELAPEVRVNAVLPGAHETPRNLELFEAAVERGEFESVQAVKEHFVETIPANRFASPEELGDLVAFLSSERAQFVNGTAIPIDGGASHSTF